MRVLWFTNSPCNYPTERRGYNGGGWMTSLQEEVAIYEKEHVELGICFVKDDEPERVEHCGVVYYPTPVAVKRLRDKFWDIVRPHDLSHDEILWSHYKRHFKKVIDNFNPDVIHIFGSELYMGLAALVSDKPCVLHLQGLVSLYICSFLPIGVSRWTYIFKDGIRGVYGNWQYLNYWKRSVYREKTIFKQVEHVIGRTHWDKKAVFILNPNVRYHYGGEMLRSCFYEPSIRIIPDKLSIVTTSSNASYKGFDLVLKIADILKNECHLDFEWSVYGNVLPDFFERITSINHEDVNVHLCGVASAQQLRDAMLCATMYVQPSYIENSPNSVAEAQMLGLPIVATNVGGTSSMVEDGVSGYLYPASDPYMAAYYIQKLAMEESLNIQMGECGKIIANRRHNKKDIISQLIETYKKVIADVE